MQNNGFDSEIKTLSTKEILVDPIYQRQYDEKRVAKMVREFNPNLVNFPKVSFRDGRYWVFDGMHTIGMLKTRNKGCDLHVTCRVFYGMTRLDEMELFVKQNGISKSVSTADKLRARYNMGDEEIVDMVRAADLAGVRVSFTGGKAVNSCTAVSTLYKSYQELPRNTFIDMLSTCRDAWDGQHEGFSSEILKGMTKFFATYQGEFSRSNLTKRLKAVSPIYIVREGKQSISRGGRDYARIILKIYNNRTKSRRLEDRL